MNGKLSPVAPLVFEGVEIQIVDDAVHFSGVISMRDSTATVTPYLLQVHRAVVQSGIKQLRVDLTKLRFMNSSAIRSLVDWVQWICKEPDADRYTLHFVTKPDVTWQATMLTAIQTLGGAHVVVLRE